MNFHTAARDQAVVLAIILVVSAPARAQVTFETTPYRAGENGYHTYRIPAAVTTPSGVVVAFCEGRKEGRSDSGDIDLVARRSHDGGRTWEGMRVIVDDGTNTCGNPAPIVDRETGDTVWVFTKNRGEDSEAEILRGEAPPRTVWLTRSTDEGVTWSNPREITLSVRNEGWRWYATGPGHGVQLASGRS